MMMMMMMMMTVIIRAIVIHNLTVRPGRLLILGGGSIFRHQGDCGALHTRNVDPKYEGTGV